MSVKRALAWCTGALLVHLALSQAYLQTIAWDHRAPELDREFLSNNAPVTLMVTGASHARNGISAPELGGISVAVAGEHYLKSMYRVPWLLDRSERRIGAVVVPFDAASFSSWKGDNFQPEYVWGAYVPFLELGYKRGKLMPYLGKWLKRHAVPYAGELEDLSLWASGKRAFQDEQDVTRFERQPTVRVRHTGAEAAALHFEGQTVMDPGKVWAFHQLVSGLRARGQRVLLISFPVHAEYTQTAQALGADPRTRERLLKPYANDRGVVWLDYHDYYNDTPEVFYDGDHLNGVGRYHFSIVLANELYQRGFFPKAPRQPSVQFLLDQAKALRR